ncbi:16S rRNA (uracil(1498)-N(3))-methyltransferase [Hyphobacterium marinum]|uniref:Ribosomal RNA small subunit methyltransferase E n=1 Tax=Hyphobacterium marinum TaxID=3116574 RepID=A0ABU7LWS1_9PROT|nr:16S rRNA (uracil(1498)-N(3))-methyltransferase [Hyphobacterium sp. Y6023]MEE2565998.1 16S rRNA (uracil(1498)-N(3))-methyltransferase [Hyphobacterium sp. Y6023]
MTIPRLHVVDTLGPRKRIALDRDATHYLVSVMRRAAGDSVRLFNGRDGEWEAVVTAASRKSAELECRTQRREQSFPPDVELLFAPVKKARTDFIVEKATELGARSIRPVITARTIADRVRTDRLSALAREAAEQTERLDLPVIAEAEKLDRVLDGWGERTLIFCDEAGDARPMLEVVQELAHPTPTLPSRGGGLALSPSPSGEGRGGGQGVSILIGPEGGFAPEERERIRAVPKAIPVTLGPRILRADTAAAAALTLWQAVCGDW